MRGDGHSVLANGARGPEPRALAGVPRAGNIVDPAALAVVVDDAAQAERLADGHVQDDFEARTPAAAGDRIRAELRVAVELLKVRLVRDQADVAGLGTGPEQRALGTGEHLDARQVRRVHVDIAARLRQRLLVQVEGDVGREARHTGDRQVGRGGGDAANVDGVLARSAAAGGHAGQEQAVFGEIGDAEVADLAGTQRRHGDGHILERCLHPCRGDDDLFESPRGGLLLRHGRGAGQRGGDGGGYCGAFCLNRNFHW